MSAGRLRSERGLDPCRGQMGGAEPAQPARAPRVEPPVVEAPAWKPGQSLGRPHLFVC